MKKNGRSRTGRRAVAHGKSGARVVIREIVRKIERPVPKDMVEARKSISDVVRGSAMDIIVALIQKAEDGELAPAKYLFEMVGLYPPTEETSSKPEDSLAYTLLQRMGLPPELDSPGETQVRCGH
jgi:hypothetical protein